MDLSLGGVTLAARVGCSTGKAHGDVHEALPDP